MTLHAKLIGSAFALAMALGSVAAPAMAATATSQSNMPNAHNCAIGETYNGGSIANEHSGAHNGDRPSDCDNIGRPGK